MIAPGRALNVSSRSPGVASQLLNDVDAKNGAAIMWQAYSLLGSGYEIRR